MSETTRRSQTAHRDLCLLRCTERAAVESAIRATVDAADARPDLEANTKPFPAAFNVKAVSSAV